MTPITKGAGYVLDSNIIIDLAERRPHAEALGDLVAAWRKGDVQLAASVVSASENLPLPHDTTTDRLARLRSRLQAAGLEGIEILKPMLIFDFSFWDEAVWADDRGQLIFDRLLELLAPSGLAAPPVDAALNSKWRNGLCDVMIAWCCLYHCRPNLITRDATRFRAGGREAALRRMGLTVLHPDELDVG
jgi:predicted nucleic acid-binding protein